MSGMPLVQALFFLGAAVALIAILQARLLHPFLALVVIATAFGLAAGFSTAFVGKSFGLGFAQNLHAPGLVIVAAGFVAALAQESGAFAFLAAAMSRRRWICAPWTAAVCGLVAGLAAAPSSAFALLLPLVRGGGEAPAPWRGRPAIALALALSAGHGLLLLSPVMIAATSILDADVIRVLLFGAPLALALTALAVVWARALPPVKTIIVPAAAAIDAPPAAAAIEPSGRAVAVLLCAMAVPLALSMVQSFGDIPSEPLGGGTARETVIGLGRPLVLFVLAVGIMVIGNGRIAGKRLADQAWNARVLGDVAALLLSVGAAGGLQRLCQETGMAELIGERLSGWHLAGPIALLVPFLVAAVIKTLQGSSLVAAITAAGIVQPLLAPLGLAQANAQALAALAVGAGAMTVSHVNDDLFWLVMLATGARPTRALTALTAGTLVQGGVALILLLACALLAGI